MRYVALPFEWDAQIAFLLSNGFADFAITEDSDLLAYGCKKVCFFKTYFPIVVGREGAKRFRLSGLILDGAGGGGGGTHIKGASLLGSADF